jgi:3-deoxy-7-phosphoheptulonate synthase
VLGDPSHATGRRDLIAPMCRAGIAAGADGLMIEVHPDPEHARCDGPQSLTPVDFTALMSDLSPRIVLEGKYPGSDS